MASVQDDGIMASIQKGNTVVISASSEDQKPAVAGPSTASLPPETKPKSILRSRKRAAAANAAELEALDASSRVIVVPRCSHATLIQHYNRPCGKCNVFCNCGLTYFINQFPDVLVRSLDKKIVRLSKHLVRASKTLSGLVNRALFNDREGRKPIPMEYVLLNTENNHPYVIQGMWRATEKQRQKFLCENQDDEEVIYNPPEKLLVLFNMKNSVPTFGASKDALLQIDKFVCHHLDQVEARVAARDRRDEFFEGRPAPIHMGLDECDLHVNTFEYEDWEEEFFNHDTMMYLQLHHANQELLVWDFFFAMEKWVLLRRGFPFRMVNGCYDALADPDYENEDNFNIYGGYNTGYVNPKKKFQNKKPNPLDVVVKELSGCFQWWTVIPKN